MLLYSLLYLSGYDLSLDDIKNFRQWQKQNPGDILNTDTRRVWRTTTGLGARRFANSARHGHGRTAPGGPF